MCARLLSLSGCCGLAMRAEGEAEMSKADSADDAMADGPGAQDPMARIAVALEMLPALRDGQVAMVNHLEALMESVERQKAETSLLNERMSDLTSRVQLLEGEAGGDLSGVVRRTRRCWTGAQQ